MSQANKYRAQILLEPEQHQALVEIAAQRQQSISHLVREIVQAYLVEQDLDAQLQEELEAIWTLAQLRQEIQAQHGTIDADLLADARDEREAELDERGIPPR